MNIRIKDDRVEIDGYVNSVERLSKPLQDRGGTFKERVKVGAFKKALERARDVRIFLNHNSKRDLGGITDGNLELKEDAIGLHARSVISDEDVVEQARRGDLVGWSFGFSDVDVEMTNENGVPVRNIKDMILYEVSLINKDAIPAYDGTLVAVRAGTDEMYNLADICETEINIRAEGTEEPEEQETPEADPEEKENKANENDNQADEQGPADYRNLYYQIIIEGMKGD